MQSIKQCQAFADKGENSLFNIIIDYNPGLLDSWTKQVNFSHQIRLYKTGFFALCGHR